MSGRLQGRIAIVTGGSRGIGLAIAQSFARQGAKVVVASRKTAGVEAAAARINAETPGSAWGRACHVGQAEAVADLVAWAGKTVGLPTILVNNAATNPYFGPMLGVTPALWDKTFEVNLKGYFEPTRRVAQALIEAQQPGSIINVASVAGLRASPLQGIYGMTKAAVISMTQTLAFELGEAGIRVNAIAPGLVDTRLAQALTSNETLSAFFTDRAAIKRVAAPEEMAGIATFLASDEASYLTGQTIAVDGGWSSA